MILEQNDLCDSICFANKNVKPPTHKQKRVLSKEAHSLRHLNIGTATMLSLSIFLAIFALTINYVFAPFTPTITFHANGGLIEKIDGDTIKYVEVLKISIDKLKDKKAIDKKPKGIRNGFQHLDWGVYTENGLEPFDFDKPITKSIDLHAMWHGNQGRIFFGCHHSEGCRPLPIENYSSYESLPEIVKWPEGALPIYDPFNDSVIPVAFHFRGEWIYTIEGNRIGDPKLVIPYDGAELEMRIAWATI